MSRTRIVFLPEAPDAPPLHLVTGPGGGVLERGPLPRLGAAEAASARCVLVAPGTDIAVRWLNAPTRNPAQARAAVALALEDELAAPVLDAHLALGALEDDGRRAVAAVAPERMQAWLQIAADHGLSPDALIPEAFLLPEPAEGEPLNLARFAGRAVVRGRRLAWSAEDDLAPRLLDGRAVRELESAELERAVVESAARPAVNLLQGRFAPARGQGPAWRDLRRAAVLAGVALLSPLLIMAAQTVRQDMAARGLEREAAARVAAVLPRGTVVDDPARQVEARLGQLRITAGAGPAALAAQLFAAIEALDQAQVESLIAMPDGTMRATLSYANYSDIDVLTAALRRGGVSLRQEGAREEAGRVVSDVLLGARP